MFNRCLLRFVIGALFLSLGYPVIASSFSALAPSTGARGDSQTSIIYDPNTGEVSVDVPAGAELTRMDISSAAGIFRISGDVDFRVICMCDPELRLGVDDSGGRLIARFHRGSGSFSFGMVTQPGLSADFLAGDLTVTGSLVGNDPLGQVDLIYIPEPSTLSLALMAAIGFGVFGRRDERPKLSQWDAIT